MAAASATSMHCRLHGALGRSEPCPGERCPLWEPGGAVLQGRCAVADVDLRARADLASWLLELRDQLEQERAAAERQRLWRTFHRLLNRNEDE